MVGHFAGMPATPGLALCSSARRAVETLEHLRPGLSRDLTVSIEADLYGASANDLLRRLRLVEEDTAVVLVVGHNPGLEDLIGRIVGAGDPTLLARSRIKYPTGALATIAFAGAWHALDWGRGTLEAFVVPSDLG